MNKTNRILASSLAIIFLSASTVGCGQGFRSNAAGGTVNQSSNSATDVSDTLAKAQEASAAAQTAMSEAQTALNEIQDADGNINIGLFRSGSAMSKGLLSPIIDKLNNVFDKVFAKIDMVKAQFAMARSKLADAIGKLDDKDPAQAALKDKVLAEMKKIDLLESNFRTKIHSLASKLDLATVALDKLISGATSFVPGWGFVIGLALDYFVMGDVKALISELKMRLLAI
jgi:hypothetical protein